MTLVTKKLTQTQPVSANSSAARRNGSPTDQPSAGLPLPADMTKNKPAQTSTDYKKFVVAGAGAIAGFAFLKVLKPDSTILALVGMAMGGAMGYFGYDTVADKLPDVSFNNAVNDPCLSFCKKCNANNGTCTKSKMGNRTYCTCQNQR